MGEFPYELMQWQSAVGSGHQAFARGRTLSGPLQDIAELEQQDCPTKRRRADFYCEICNQSFTERRALLRHRKENQRHLAKVNAGAARRHVCPECNKGFARDHDLKRHRSEVHQAKQRKKGMHSITTIFRHHSDDSSTRSGHESEDSLNDNEPHMKFEFHGYGASSHEITHETKEDEDMDEDVAPEVTPVSRRASSIFSKRPSISTVSLSRSRTMSQCPIPEVRQLPHPAQRHHSLTASMYELQHTPKPELERAFTEPPLPWDDSEEDLAHWLNLAEGEYFTKLNDEYMILNGASNKASPTRIAQCPVCRAPHRDISKLLQCMAAHLEAPQRAHLCPHCQFGFVRADHLTMHLHSVDKDHHCGFRFPHDCQSGGHHPKSELNPTDQHESLHARMEAWYLLQLFFKARQLSAKLNAAGDTSKSERRWSLAVLRNRVGSRFSVISALNVRATTMPTSMGGSDGKERHSAWHIQDAFESLAKVARRFRGFAMHHEHAEG